MAASPTFIRNFLSSIGLSSLTTYVENLLVDDPSLAEGANLPVLELMLRETPEYKQRFKGNEARRQKGLTEYSAADYLRIEDSL